jgi:hypothetical protein
MLYDMCISVAVLIACAIIVCLAAYMSRKFSSDVYEDDLYECIYDEDGNAHTVNVGSRPATTSHDQPRPSQQTPNNFTTAIARGALRYITFTNNLILLAQC